MMQMLSTPWLTIVGICRLRLGPQDLPASFSFMIFTLLIYTVVNGLISLVQNTSLETAMLAGFAETILSILLTSSLLYITRHPSRIMQTMTAVASTGSVIGLIAIPLIIWYQWQIKEHIIGISFVLLLALIVWSLMVHAHILRHALTVSFFTGLTIALIMSFLTYSILSTLFPFSE